MKANAVTQEAFRIITHDPCWKSHYKAFGEAYFYQKVTLEIESIHVQWDTLIPLLKRMAATRIGRVIND